MSNRVMFTGVMCTGVIVHRGYVPRGYCSLGLLFPGVIVRDSLVGLRGIVSESPKCLYFLLWVWRWSACRHKSVGKSWTSGPGTNRECTKEWTVDVTDPTIFQCMHQWLDVTDLPIFQCVLVDKVKELLKKCLSDSGGIWLLRIRRSHRDIRPVNATREYLWAKSYFWLAATASRDE